MLLTQVKENLRMGIHEIKSVSAQPVLGTYYYAHPFLRCPFSPIGFLLFFMTLKVNHYVDELNELIYELAKEEDIPVSDINGALRMMPFWCYHDSHHANLIGNYHIANIWFSTVSPFLDY